MVHVFDLRYKRSLFDFNRNINTSPYGFFSSNVIFLYGADSDVCHKSLLDIIIYKYIQCILNNAIYLRKINTSEQINIHESL